MDIKKHKQNLEELKILIQNDINDLMNKYSNSKTNDIIFLGVLKGVVKNL